MPPRASLQGNVNKVVASAAVMSSTVDFGVPPFNAAATEYLPVGVALSAMKAAEAGEAA